MIKLDILQPGGVVTFCNTLRVGTDVPVTGASASGRVRWIGVQCVASGDVMNFLRFCLCLIGWLAILPVCAGGPPESASVAVFGTDPDLSAGATALRLGDFEAGIRLTLLGLKHAPSPRNRASGFSNLCAGYVGAHQYDKAIEACDAALKISRNNWHIYNNRALALLGLGRVAEARRDHATGLVLKPAAATLEQVGSLIDARAAEGVLAGVGAAESAAAAE